VWDLILGVIGYPRAIAGMILGACIGWLGSQVMFAGTVVEVVAIVAIVGLLAGLSADLDMWKNK
jgi:hypothetical protein